MFERKPNKSLDYVYEILEDVVKTYEIQKIENQLFCILNGHYYLDILGERTIEKLRGRGYLSMEEACYKYQVTEIPILTDTKKGGFMKTLFKKN